MKTLLVFFAIFALTTGFEFAQRLEATQFSVSSEIVKGIENAKFRMPCGFPEYGIPPLAPLLIEHKEVKLGGEDFSLSGDVNNVRVDGIDYFDVVEFKVSPLNKINFKFVWNHVILNNTLYDMHFKKGQLNMKRNGIANIEIKGLEIWGQIKYKTGILGGKSFQIKEFKVYTSLAEINSQIEGLMKNKYLNRLANQMIEEWFMLAINDNTDNIAEISDKIMVPMLNEMIGDKTLKEIIGMVGGGGGEKPEKPACNPPPRNFEAI